MTINIIEKWGNLGKNYLDVNLEYTRDRTKKISLEQAFKDSIKLLLKNSDIDQDLNTLTNTFYEITRRYTKAITKVEPDSSNLKKIFTVFMDRIIKQFTDKFNFDEIYHCISSLQKNQNTVDYVISRKILSLASKKIVEPEESNHNRGIIYEIKNNKGCSSYMIGTIHISPKHLNGSKILEKVLESNELIIEAGTFTLYIGSVTYNIPLKDLPALPPLIKEIIILEKKNHMEFYLIQKIIEKGNILLSALETFAAQEVAKKESSKYDSLPILPRKIRKLIDRGEQLENIEKFKKYPTVCMLEAWKTGDIKKIKYIDDLITHPRAKSISQKGRNLAWIRNKEINLIDKLQNAERSIAIAVGTGHLYGKTGLLKVFQEAGLQIQQI